jgi:hypothetical protein
MNQSVSAAKTNDFYILGPALASGKNVLEAVHALYFLPENYKLIFTGAEPVDHSFYTKVVDLVERDELGERVKFTTGTAHPDVVISTNSSDSAKTVTGDSAEALASAILTATR